MTLVDPRHLDPLSSSSGKAQTQYVKDLNDQVEAIAPMLLGPAFRNPMAYSAIAATPLANAEALTADAPFGSAWTAASAFTAAAPSTTHTQGTNSIKTTLRFNTTGNSFYVVLGSNRPVGSYHYVAFDLRWSYPSQSNFDPNLFMNARMTDGAGISLGTRIDIELGTLPEDTWNTILIPVGALASVRTIGILKVRNTVEGQPVQDSTSSSGNRIDYWIDNVRFLAVTELDAAINDAPGAVLVPTNYTPSQPQGPVGLPADRTVVDLRPTNAHISRLGGVRHLREFGIPEDGVTDVAGQLGAVLNSLAPGTELHFPPNTQFNMGTGIVWNGPTDVKIEGHGSMLYATPSQTWLDGTITKSAPTWTQLTMVDPRNLKINDLKLIGYRTGLYTGNICVNKVGTPSVSGTTKLLTIQNQEIYPTSTARRYARDKDMLLKFSAVLSDSAQIANDCQMSLIDGSSGAVIASRVITLTATPTSYECSFTPNDEDLGRSYFVTVRKLTATANTISVASITDFGMRGYWLLGGPGDSAMEYYHGLDVEGGNTVLLDNMHVEGWPGDGIQLGGDVWHATIRHFFSRVNSRQGFSAQGTEHLVLEDFVIREAARSGMDFEPQSVLGQTNNYVRISRGKILNSTNAAIANGPWSQNSNFTIEDIVAVGAGTGVMSGGFCGGLISNFYAQNCGPFFVKGQNILVSGVNTNGDFLVPDESLSARPLNDVGPLDVFYSGGMTIMGLRCSGRVQVKGSSTLIGGVGAFSTTMDVAYGDFTSSQVGSFDLGRGANLLDTNTEFAALDTGRYRFSFPKTYKPGLAFSKVWTPGGFDANQDPHYNMRAIGSTTTKGNNLAGMGVVVAAGATSQAVTFPLRNGPGFLTSPDPTGSNSGGTIAAGTWYVRVGARDLYGGPASWSGEDAVVIGGAGTGSITVAANGWARVGVGWQAPGITILRGSVAGGPYTVRYDFLPDEQFYGLRQDTNSFVDNNTTLAPTSISAADMWGYPVSVAKQIGSWSAVNQSGYEPDTNYAVFIDASWPTACTVVKALGGFTVTFSVPCPTIGGTFNWMVVRG